MKGRIVSSNNSDGYSNSTRRIDYNNIKDNNVKSITLNYDLKGVDVKAADIQLFVDDFQPQHPAGFKSTSSNYYGSTAVYQVTLQGAGTSPVRVPELEQIINSLDQSGPIGKMITLSIPQSYLSIIKTGSLTLKIDDPTVRSSYPDGYAIDFVKLSINPKKYANIGTLVGHVIDGTVYKNSGFKTIKPLANATVMVGDRTTVSDANGQFTFNDITAGTEIVTASLPKYTGMSQGQPYDIIAGKITTDTNSDGSLNGDKCVKIYQQQIPTAPIIHASTYTITNADIGITIDYPDSPTYKQYSFDNKTWTDYPSAGFTVPSNCTIYARSSYDNSTWANSSLNITNIDKSIPEAPQINEDITGKTTGPVHITMSNGNNSALTMYISTDTGKTWTKYTGAVELSTNSTVQGKNVNAAGTSSPITTLNVNNIYTKAPAITHSNVVNGNVTVTITKNDTDNDTIVYWKTDSSGNQLGDKVTVTNSNHTITFTVSSNCTINATEQATGKNISDTATDAISNLIPAAPVITPSTTAPTNQDVTITVTYPGSPAYKQYSLDGTNWIDYKDGGFPVSSNGTVYARSSYDGTNWATSSLDIKNIDKSAPTAPQLTEDITGKTPGPVHVTMTNPNSNTSGQVMEISTDGGKTWAVYSGAIEVTVNETVMGRVKNALGTYSDVTTLVIDNIYTVAPSIKHSDIKDDVVTVTITKNGSSSDIIKYWYTDNDGNKIGDVTTVTDNNTTVTFTVNSNCNISATETATGKNESDPANDTINVFAVDMPKISHTPSNDTDASKVTVTITPNKAGDTVKYVYVDKNGKDKNGNTVSMTDTSSWSTYSSPFDISNNGFIKAVEVDSVHNVRSSIASDEITNILPGPPKYENTVTATTPGGNDSEISVTITKNNDNDVVYWWYVDENGTQIGEQNTYDGNPIGVTKNSNIKMVEYDPVYNKTSEAVTDKITDIYADAPTLGSKESLEAYQSQLTLVVGNYPSDAKQIYFKFSDSKYIDEPLGTSSDGKAINTRVIQPSDAAKYNGVEAYYITKDGVKSRYSQPLNFINLVNISLGSKAATITIGNVTIGKSQKIVVEVIGQDPSNYTLELDNIMKDPKFEECFKGIVSTNNPNGDPSIPQKQAITDSDTHPTIIGYSYTYTFVAQKVSPKITLQIKWSGKINGNPKPDIFNKPFQIRAKGQNGAM